MEAVALYTFRATEGDELSFNKGDILKVRAAGRPSCEAHLEDALLAVTKSVDCPEQRRARELEQDPGMQISCCSAFPQKDLYLFNYFHCFVTEITSSLPLLIAWHANWASVQLILRYILHSCCVRKSLLP